MKCWNNSGENVDRSFQKGKQTEIWEPFPDILRDFEAEKLIFHGKCKSIPEIKSETTEYLQRENTFKTLYFHTK